MRKGVKTFIALAAMLAVAAPAMAQVKFSGVFAVQGYHQNFTGAAGDLFTTDKKNSRSFIDQRFRPKVDYKLNDYVSLTYFAEIDTIWGSAGKLGAGTGGDLGTDGVNIESKQIFVDFAIPDTKSKLRLGLQGVKDAFDGIVTFDDMAGAVLSGKLGPMDYRGIYAKWNEGDQFGADDLNFYGLDLSHKYGDFAKAGISVYYMDDKSNIANASAGINAQKNQIWWVGVNGDYRFANFALDGFLVYQFGDTNVGVPGPAGEQDTKAFAATVAGKMLVDNGNLSLRYIFFSKDDEANERNQWQGFKTNGQNHAFVDENLMIFLVDRDVMNAGKNGFALRDAAAAGYGLHAVVFSGNFKKLPMDTFANFGIGGFWAGDDRTDGAAVANRNGKTLGYEFAAKVGKTFAEKFEVSLRGSYALLGNFYESMTPGVSDPDDAYTVALMARVPF